MSTNRSPVVKYECMGCKPGPDCPGHELWIRDHITSGIVTIVVDGQDKYCMSDGEFSAILEAHEKLYPNVQSESNRKK